MHRKIYMKSILPQIIEQTSQAIEQISDEYKQDLEYTLQNIKYKSQLSV